MSHTVQALHCTTMNACISLYGAFLFRVCCVCALLVYMEKTVCSEYFRRLYRRTAGKYIYIYIS